MFHISALMPLGLPHVYQSGAVERVGAGLRTGPAQQLLLHRQVRHTDTHQTDKLTDRRTDSCVLSLLLLLLVMFRDKDRMERGMAKALSRGAASFKVHTCMTSTLN